MRAVTSPLVGREDDIAALQNARATALKGQAVTVLIGGEAGVGKTRLVEEFIAGAADGAAIVATGHCADLGEIGTAFAPIAEILRDLARQFGADRVISAAGLGRAALAGIAPEIFDDLAGDPDVAARPLEMVCGLLEELASERPLILVLEDLHWADASTRGLLAGLARYVTASPILLLATYRSDDIHRRHPLRPLLAELVRLRGVQRLDVGRLERDCVAEQLSHILGTAPTTATVDRMFDRTDGIPFFVEELAAAEDGQDAALLPDTVRDVLLVRVDQLSPSAQNVLRAMSVCGDRLSHGLAVAVADCNAEALDSALREIVEANIVRPEGEGYAFRHALVREALYEDHLPGVRERTHARCAHALEQHGGLANSSYVAATIAYHWSAARHHKRAFAAYLRAADEAERIYARAEAHRALERALELWDLADDPVTVSGGDHAGVVMRAATAACEAGEFQRSFALAETALAELEIEDDLERAGVMHFHKASMALEVNRPDSRQILEEALDVVPPSPPSVPRARLLVLLAESHMFDDRNRDAIDVARQAIDVAQAVGDTFSAVGARTAAGPCLMSLGKIDEALLMFNEARHEAKSERRRLVLCENNLASSLAKVGRFEEAALATEIGIEHCRSLGILGTTLHSTAAQIAFAKGDWMT